MLENLVQSPENKIKNASKILDTAASNLNKELTNITKNLLDINSVERKNTETLSKFLFAEDLTKTTRTNAPLITTQGAQQASQVRKQEEQQPKSQTAPSALGSPGSFFAAASANITPGTRFKKMQDISSIVSPGSSGQFLAFSLYGMREGGMHRGLDISGPPGTFIALKVDCEVLNASVTIDNSGFGKWIAVWVPSLSVQLLFGHCNEVFFSSGRIPAGKSFATLGSTGKSSGPHIHLQYSKSKRVFATDGPPDEYVTLLFLTKTKSEGFTQPQSLTRPAISNSRTGVLTPESRRNKPTSMLLPSLQQNSNEIQVKSPQAPPQPLNVNTASLVQIVAAATIR